MKYKGIIFDRDGTLYDSLDVILRAFDHAIEPYTEKRPTIEEWFAAFGPAEMDVIAKFIDPEKKQEAFNRFFDYYRTHFGEIHFYPGMRELLLELKRKGAKLMLFTGGGHLSTRFCLEQTGVLHLFDALVSQTRSGRGFEAHGRAKVTTRRYDRRRRRCVRCGSWKSGAYIHGVAVLE